MSAIISAGDRSMKIIGFFLFCKYIEADHRDFIPVKSLINLCELYQQQCLKERNTQLVPLCNIGRH